MDSTVNILASGSSAPAEQSDSTISGPERMRAAQRLWADVPMGQRLEAIRRLRHAIAARGRELCDAIACPNRTAADSLVAEIIPLADACRFLEREAQRILRPVRWGRRSRPLWLFSTQLEIRREPLGVALIVAPSNYPLLLPGVQTIQALAAGNAVIVKPAPGHRRPMQLLASLAYEAGLPRELLTVADEGIPAVDEAVRSGVDKVFLTGSVHTGRAVMGKLVEGVIPSVMELSGCDAVFVCGDADLDLVTRALAFGLSFNGSATCIAPRRIFVPRHHQADLEQRLHSRLRAMPPVKVAPRVVSLLRRLIEQATSSGARLLNAPGNGADRVSPVLLSDAHPDMALLKEDVFAPVMSIVPVDGMEQALEFNAACPYALAATIFGGEAQARELAGRVNAGVVVVNDMLAPHADPRVPFAPRGLSGFGSTRGAEGLLEMTRPKAISVRGGRFRPHLDAPRPGDDEMFLQYLRAAHGRGRRLRSLLGFARRMMSRGSAGGS